MLEELCGLRKQIWEAQPLIHCLANHITSNDCANAVLAVGAKPIMAEHPGEVAQVTGSADALAVNLGNINEARLKSMLISGHQAKQQGLPCIVDLVGVGCSELRLHFARRFIAECQPAVIKGNVSEIKALLDNTSSRGVDVSQQDEKLGKSALVKLAQRAASQCAGIVLVTGPIDVIATKDKVFLLDNGHPLLARITGTGCVLGVLCATFMSSCKLLEGVILACLLLSISGELAAEAATGPASFKLHLFDWLHNLTDQALCARAKISEVRNEKL